MRNKIKIKTFLDLSIILLWTFFGSVSMILFEENIIRTIFGISMVLFFPGYVLTLVSYPKKKDLEITERLAISLGLSIVVISILGLILNFTVGLRLTEMFISIIIYFVPMTILAFYRRYKLNEDEIFFVDIISIIDIRHKKVDVLGIILIMTMTITIVFVSYVIITPKVGEQFTEFYILDENKKVDNYNRDIEIGKSINYTLGISNHEYASVKYTIKVSLDDNILTTREIDVENNEKWEGNIDITPTKEGKKLEFLLYKENNFTIPYRKLNLWMKT